MRSLRVNVSGKSFQVEVEDVDQSPITVRVDGTVYLVSVDWQEATANTAAMPGPIPTQSPEEAMGQGADRPAPPPTSAGVERHSARALESPMPGTIVEVAVKAGDRVERGQEICVLEAMKMRNSVKAARPGVIAEVLVAPGSKVAHGDPLVRFAPVQGPAAAGAEG